jgi:DNA-binding response OmpR family regulator
MIRAVLESAAFRVLEAPSGQAALALAQHHGPTIDLAIIDLMMPGMGGLDVASSLAEGQPGLKVLYISGAVGSVAVHSLVSSAPRLILQKPFTPDQLMDRVRSVLT